MPTCGKINFYVLDLGNNMTNASFSKALTIIGLTQAQFAQALGLTPPAVSAWKRKGIPVKTCVVIERMTNGAINRRDLRNDAHEIWEPLD